MFGRYERYACKVFCIKYENFQGGQHDQAVFLYTHIYETFRVEGFIEFFYKPNLKDKTPLPPYFLEATLFTYSIEHYGRCGLETDFNSKLRAHQLWDYCSILRRYQGRTDFILDDVIRAKYKQKLDLWRTALKTGQSK